jgi:peptidoglycan hydrolase-like protein with peptidoglycan-binding domain
MTNGYFTGKAPSMGVITGLDGGNIIVRTAINGKCTNSVNQCSQGIFIDNSDTSTQSKWICAGLDGGSADYCSLNKPNSGGNETGGGGGGGGTNSGNNNNNNNNNSNNNQTENRNVPRIVTTPDVKVVPVPTTVTSSVIKNTIKVGSTGDEVKIVQSYLIEKGYLKISAPTGYFGTITQKAVGIYQVEKGIIPSVQSPGFGQIGPKTRTELNKDLTGKSSVTVPSTSTNNSTSIPQTVIQNTPTVTTSSGSQSVTKNLSPGSRGQEVKALQSILVEQNIIPSKYVTGYYGKITETAVKSLQSKYNIVNYGTPSTTGYGAVGPKTRKVINSL